jgi:hypothetical protein
LFAGRRFDETTVDDVAAQVGVVSSLQQEFAQALRDRLHGLRGLQSMQRTQMVQRDLLQ